MDGNGNISFFLISIRHILTVRLYYWRLKFINFFLKIISREIGFSSQVAFISLASSNGEGFLPYHLGGISAF